MGVSPKQLSLLLIVVLASSSLIMVDSASASNSLSVPEFTVKVVPLTWDVEYPQAVELQIKNQPFTPYNNSQGYEVNLYYNIRTKLHNETEWTESDNLQYARDKWVNTGGGYIKQSDTNYTSKMFQSLPLDNAKRDYQVQAIEGYFKQYAPFMLQPIFYPDFAITRITDWSPTQILTMNRIGSIAAIDKSATTTTSMPITPTPTLEQPPAYLPYVTPIIIAVVIVLGGGLFVYDQRKHR